MNATVIPTGRDNTYSPDEVHRKSSEEKYETAFNKDQKEVLDNFTPSGGGSTAPLIARLTITFSEGTGNRVFSLDKTWQQIHDAFPNTFVECLAYPDSGNLIDIRVPFIEVNRFVDAMGSNPTVYTVAFDSEVFGLRVTCGTESPDGYPSWNEIT